MIYGSAYLRLVSRCVTKIRRSKFNRSSTASPGILFRNVVKLTAISCASVLRLHEYFSHFFLPLSTDVYLLPLRLTLRQSATASYFNQETKNLAWSNFILEIPLWLPIWTLDLFGKYYVCKTHKSLDICSTGKFFFK